MVRKILCGVLVTVSLLTGLVAYAETMKDIQEYKNCKYCNMDREKFAHSRMLIEYGDGSSLGACSIHCVAIDLSQSFDKQPKAILAADYNQKNLIEAEKAYWVIGGKKPGVMTKTAKWAFADKKDAEAFIKENGGKMGTFDDAMKATYEDMYNDTKMIWEKRAKMKAMQPEKKP
jgi:copper chaperone NosL